MDKSDLVNFTALMRGMADNFRDSITDAGLEMRWKMLKRYSFDKVEMACLKIMETRHFTKMPTMADFIEAIDGPKKDTRDLGEGQWAIVMDQVRRVGYVGTPVFDDPVTRELVDRRFRWTSLCAMTTRDLGFEGRRFVDAYQAVDARRQHEIGYDERLAITGGEGKRGIEEGVRS